MISAARHCRGNQMSYGFIPLNSFELLLFLLQEEPRIIFFMENNQPTSRAKHKKKGRKNHKVVLNKLKKRIGEDGEEEKLRT
ncbi:hypothetical protein KR009_004931, partial [Drosophila setifemur]